jgi:hypothetical protein
MAAPFLEVYRIDIESSHGTIMPRARSAIATQRGGTRPPLPVPCMMAMINAKSASTKVIMILLVDHTATYEKSVTEVGDPCHPRI